MTIASTVAAPGLVRETFGKDLRGQNSHIDLATGAPLDAIATDTDFWLKIREDFPIIKSVLYMNNGTMGPSPRPITERVMKRIEHVDNTGDYGGDIEAIRKAIAGVIGAAGPDEIALTHNVSEAISIISSGLELKAGDEVILTDQEHGGNAVAWLSRKKRDGIVIKFVTLAPTDEETLARFKAAITDRTRAIAVPHVTCTTGQVLPIKEISAMARKKNIWVMADGAHPPGMMEVNVKDLGVHAYTSCGHKWLCGPKGTGFLYIAPEMLEHVIPTWAGAESDKYWDYTGQLDYLPTASRFDFASQNFALYDGLHGAIDYMQNIGIEKIQARLQHLTTMLRNGLREVAGDRFHFLTPPTSVTGLTTIKLHNMKCDDFFSTMWSKHNIRTRVVHESKLDANRLSVHIYTSEEDIAKFLDAAKAVIV